MGKIVLPLIINTTAPTTGNTIVAGYPLGQHWFDSTAGVEYIHKSDSVWETSLTGINGATGYTGLANKPQINSVELAGNKTSSDLGLQPAGNYATGGGTATGTNTGDEIAVGTTTPTGNEDLWIDPTTPEITTADIPAVIGYRYLNESQYNGIWSTGIQVGNNIEVASSSNVGRIRYRTIGNNSYVEMCMQTSANTYDWKIIYQNNW
jgi:hypothetical protein